MTFSSLAVPALALSSAAFFLGKAANEPDPHRAVACGARLDAECSGATGNSLLAREIVKRRTLVDPDDTSEPADPDDTSEPAHPEAHVDDLPPPATERSEMLLNAACQPAEGKAIRRLRMEVRQVEDGAWELLKSAWRGIEKNRDYDYFGERHQEAYASPRDDHGGPTRTSFLPFHRMLSLDLENMLRQQAINEELEEDLKKICSMTVPYWDWTDHDLDMVLNAKYLGRQDPKSGCIVDGLPGNFSTPAEWLHEPGASPCVARNLKMKSPKIDADDAFGTISIARDSFVKFAKDVEKMHNDIHGVIGGNMAHRVEYHSPSDPAFFFHHIFVDYLWACWQRKNVAVDIEEMRDTLSKKSSNDRSELAPWISPYDKKTNCIVVPGSSLAPEKDNTCLQYKAERKHLSHLHGECAELMGQIMEDECSAEELEAIPCADTPECRQWDANMLCADEDGVDCVDMVDLQTSEDKAGEHCKTFDSKITSHAFCHDCSFKCTGR